MSLSDEQIASHFASCIDAFNSVKSTHSMDLDKDTKLKIYAHFKQGSFGDAPTDPPSRFDVVDFLKWNEWNKLRGMPKNNAQILYCDLYNSLRKFHYTD